LGNPEARSLVEEVTFSSFLYFEENPDIARPIEEKVLHKPLELV
jgi:hypothetical protein